MNVCKYFMRRVNKPHEWNFQWTLQGPSKGPCDFWDSFRLFLPLQQNIIEHILVLCHNFDPSKWRILPLLFRLCAHQSRGRLKKIWMGGLVPPFVPIFDLHLAGQLIRRLFYISFIIWNWLMGFHSIKSEKEIWWKFEFVLTFNTNRERNRSDMTCL